MNLKQLSEKLGLSQTTVSRALNGFPEVAEKTRARVAAAAEEFNYTPSQAARGLATGKVGAVGHIIPMGKHRMINPHFSDFMAGAGAGYSANGLDIVMSICDPDQELATYERLAHSGRVDGFVLQGPLVDDPRVGLLQDLKVPFMVHGRSDNAAGYNFLDVDNAGSFRRATQYLLELGHTRFGLLNGLEHMNFAHQRRLGFETALANAGVTPVPDWMFSEDMSEAYGFEATQELLGSGTRPTAILSASKLVAFGAMRAISEAGLQVARDISLLTFDDDFAFLGTHAPVPQITCLRSSLYAAGERVSEVIHHLISEPTSTVTEVWEPELLIGKSTGPAPR